MSRRLLNPLPLERTRRAPAGLDVTCKIETATGWLDLNSGVGYRLEGSSFAEQATTWRKNEVTSPYVEGTFVTHAVRENVTETLAVWVSGASHYEMAERQQALTEALGQLAYRVMVRFDDVARYWDCQPADYTISMQREYAHARLSIVNAQVPRAPTEEVVLAAGDEL